MRGEGSFGETFGVVVVFLIAVVLSTILPRFSLIVLTAAFVISQYTNLVSARADQRERRELKSRMELHFLQHKVARDGNCLVLNVQSPKDGAWKKLARPNTNFYSQFFDSEYFVAGCTGLTKLIVYLDSGSSLEFDISRLEPDPGCVIKISEATNEMIGDYVIAADDIAYWAEMGLSIQIIRL